MDTLRRLIQPAAGPRPNQVRRVVVPPDKQEMNKLRWANKNMAEALDQLLQGVPLNWGQVEDDPELHTLARLQVAAQECRLEPVAEVKPAERAILLNSLSGTLNKIKHAPAPKVEKVAPKSLAGFSEKVQVLTQVEDDVPINTNIIALIGRIVAIAAVGGLAVWGVFTVVGLFSTPTFSWIELKRGDTTVNKIERVGIWQSFDCKVSREANIVENEYYQPFTSKRDAGDTLDFLIPTLPSLITQPTTYTLSLDLTSIAPCVPNKIVDSDNGALLKLDYSVRHALSGPDAPSGPTEVSGPLSVYVAKDQPTPFDVSTGSWREVRVTPDNGKPVLHGVLWHGTPYYDRSGVRWAGDVNVLMLERGELLYTLVGSPSSGITEDVLLALAKQSPWQQ